MSAQEATRRASQAQTSEDSPVTPLGTVKIVENAGTLTISMPKRTADRLGFEAGDELEVGWNSDARRWVYQSIEEWNGWG